MKIALTRVIVRVTSLKVVQCMQLVETERFVWKLMKCHAQLIQLLPLLIAINFR